MSRLCTTENAFILIVQYLSVHDTIKLVQVSRAFNSALHNDCNSCYHCLFKSIQCYETHAFLPCQAQSLLSMASFNYQKTKPRKEYAQERQVTFLC